MFLRTVTWLWVTNLVQKDNEPEKICREGLATMKPEITRRETIKPSSPTPNSQRWYKLSLFDQMSYGVYIPIILFYTSNGGDNPVDFSHRLSGLKKSLSETLTRYYPLAGRIGDGGSIECNDKGVDFFEARMHCHLQGFLNHPEFEALNLLAQGQIQCNNLDLSSTLIVQITFFDCGGMAIGVSMSHKVADISSMSAFLNDWATMARQSGEAEISAQFITSFFPPHDSLDIPEYVPRKINRVVRRFVFNASKLDALKTLATSHGVENPTRVQVVTALLYKCADAASRAVSDSPRASDLVQMVNLRRLVIPPLPDKSFGNLVWCFSISATEEGEVEFHDLVAQLKEGIAGFRLTYGISFSWYELSRLVSEFRKASASSFKRKGNMVRFTCTSWCRSPLYQVDFGWGKPVWISCTNVMWNTFILMDTRSGDGIEALVSLEEQNMNVFEHDEELLRFASLNPNAFEAP